MAFAEFAVLRCTVTIWHAAQNLAAMATTAFVYLTNLVAAFHNTLASTAVGDAVSSPQVVLRAPKRFATLTRTFMLQANTPTKCPVLAVINFAFLTTAMGLAKATTSVYFCAVFCLTFLATTVRNTSATTDISFLATFVLTKSAATMGFAVSVSIKKDTHTYTRSSS